MWNFNMLDHTISYWTIKYFFLFFVIQFIAGVCVHYYWQRRPREAREPTFLTMYHLYYTLNPDEAWVEFPDEFETNVLDLHNRRFDNPRDNELEELDR